MLSEVVTIKFSTRPFSLPMLITQLPVLLSIPCSVLGILFVESIFRILPYTAVAIAFFGLVGFFVNWFLWLVSWLVNFFGWLIFLVGWLVNYLG